MRADTVDFNDGQIVIVDRKVIVRIARDVNKTNAIAEVYFESSSHGEMNKQTAYRLPRSTVITARSDGVGWPG